MHRLMSAAVSFLCIVGFAVVAEAHDGTHDSSRNPTTGPASAYAFALPEPGTYRLPPIRVGAGGRVLTEAGAASDLALLFAGRITVFSFIYTRCADICPVTTMQLSQLRELARRHRELDGRLRLVSMSFDPDHDTPAIMAEYGLWWRDADDGGVEWLFLTAPDNQSLRATLAAYDQAVAPKPDADDPMGGLNHILRAFLIDEIGVIRNIYSLDFLDPNLVLTDIRTLVREGATAGQF